MRALLLASACIVVVSGPALACRGTNEYPEAARQLEQSKISPEQKNELMEQLSQGKAMHKDAHSEGDMMKMGDSIRILDGIKARMGK